MKQQITTDIRENRLQAMQRGIDQMQDRLHDMRADLLIEFAKSKLQITNADQLGEVTDRARARMQTTKLHMPRNQRSATIVKMPSPEAIIEKAAHTKEHRKRRKRTNVTPELISKVTSYLEAHPEISNVQLAKVFDFAEVTAQRLRQKIAHVG